MPARWDRLREWCRTLGVIALASLTVAVGLVGYSGVEPQRQTPAEDPGPPSSGDDAKGSGTLPTASPAQRKTANLTWKSRLRVLHQKLHGGSARGRTDDEKRQARDDAEAEILQITDPKAAPALWQNLGGQEAHHYLLARTLDRLGSPESTRMLAALAVYSEDEKARRWATRALSRRDPAQFVEPLVRLFNRPLNARLEQTGRGAVLLIEDEFVDYQLLFPPAQNPRGQGVGKGVYTPENPYVYMTKQQRKIAEQINQNEVAIAKAMRKQQIQEAREQVDRLNERIGVLNDRALGALRQATGESIDADREEWRRWLARRLDRPYRPPPSRVKVTVAEVVRPLYSPAFIVMPAPT